jgi:hypothetical protein
VGPNTGIYDEFVHRGHPRFALKIPLQIRLISRPSPSECVGESINVSSHGVYLISDGDFTVGESIQITLSMPAEISGQAKEERRCFTGHVIHATPVGNRQQVIGVQFVYSEKI